MRKLGQQGQACAREADAGYEENPGRRSGRLGEQQGHGAGGGGIGHGSSRDATGRHGAVCETESRQDASGHPILTQEAAVGYSW